METLAIQLREKARAQQLVYQNEIELQNIIERWLMELELTAVREFRFDAHDCIDFFLFATGTGIEVKTEGGLHPILRQLKRYSLHPAVKELILVCPKPWQLPRTLTDKPIHCVSLFTSLI
jgi:hypothetical protein